jgi:hypothetical protein
MNTATAIDITMKELHGYFQDYQAVHQDMADPEQIIIRAIHARWPGADPDEVLRQAEINWLKQERTRIVREAGSKLSKWIETTARSKQGDLFDTMPDHIQLKVPPRFLLEGESDPVPYWKVSIADALPYFQVKEQALSAEEAALRQAADEKKVMKELVRMQVERVSQLIRMAESNGIDPKTVRYVQKGA